MTSTDPYETVQTSDCPAYAARLCIGVGRKYGASSARTGRRCFPTGTRSAARGHGGGLTEHLTLGYGDLTSTKD